LPGSPIIPALLPLGKPSACFWCIVRVQELVEKALDSEIRVLATVPACRLPFVDRLKRRSDVALAEVTPSNRDLWPNAILSHLK